MHGLERWFILLSIFIGRLPIFPVSSETDDGNLNINLLDPPPPTLVLDLKGPNLETHTSHSIFKDFLGFDVWELSNFAQDQTTQR